MKRATTPGGSRDELCGRPLHGEERYVYIDGSPNQPIWRTCLAITFLGLGIFLWQQMESPWTTASEGEMALIYLAILSFTIALCLPHRTQTFLDLAQQQIVMVDRYIWFEISKRCAPFSEFRGIVVRQLCHSGEGGDSYSGSVGLKPSDGSTVWWLKHFPADADEIPQPAIEFALALQKLTGFRCITREGGCRNVGNEVLDTQDIGSPAIVIAPSRSGPSGARPR